MHSLNRLWMKLRMLFGRALAGRQLQDELGFHLEQQVAENLAAGMSRIEARQAALRTFGNPALLREQARATWSWNSLELLWRDFRYGARTLRRTPGFAVMAILVMALGIALGAQREQVLRLVLLDGLRPAIFGLAIGLLASVATTRLIASMLYGTKPLDPVIFAVVAGILLLVAAVACLAPAWRASRLDPMQALRVE